MANPGDTFWIEGNRKKWSVTTREHRYDLLLRSEYAESIAISRDKRLSVEDREKMSEIQGERRKQKDHCSRNSIFDRSLEELFVKLTV